MFIVRPREKEINVKPDIQKYKDVSFCFCFPSPRLSFSTLIVGEELTVLADEGAGKDVGAVEGERGREGDGGCGRVTVLRSLFEVVKDLDQ